MSLDAIARMAALRQGQTQVERAAAALDAGSVAIEPRDAVELLGQLRSLAANLKFYQGGISPADVIGDWASFLPEDAEAAQSLLQQADGGVNPQQSLLLAFLKLRELVRLEANQLSHRHLAFQMQAVLGFAPKPAVPDRAHVCLTLKPRAQACLLTPQHRFSAGKSASGVELLYAPTQETLIQPCRVAALKALYLDDDGRARAAPVANSADGLGAPLSPELTSWAPFADAAWPMARQGLALASPLLFLAEGERQVQVDLRLATPLPDISAAAWDAAFVATLTTAKGWTDALPVECRVTSASELRCTLRLAADAPAIVAAQAAIHGDAYGAGYPVLTLCLAEDGPVSAGTLRGLLWQQQRIHVAVQGMQKTVAGRNDLGAIKLDGSFLPFGPAPEADASFSLQCPELFAKPWQRLELRWQWQGAPESLRGHYAHYGLPPPERFGRVNQDPKRLGRDQSFDRLGRLPASHAKGLFVAEARVGTAVLASTVDLFSGTGKSASFSCTLTPPPNLPAGAGTGLSLHLDRGFLASSYQKLTLEYALKYAKDGGALVTLNPPYQPKACALSLDYTASSAWLSAQQGTADARCYHLDAFGAYPAADTLLPQQSPSASLLIGLADALPGGSLSLYFELEASSRDPDVAIEPLQWSVLAGDHWQPLTPTELRGDSSLGLLQSGIVQILLPSTASLAHSRMPAGLIWLRLGLARAALAQSRLRQVSANGVEVQLVTDDPGAAHRARPLAAGSIGKIKLAPEAIKSVQQSAESFGGSPAERPETLAQRAAERLRHRARAISLWDYERLALQAFPEVYQAKCIAHTNGAGCGLSPGEVLLVVVPRLSEVAAAQRNRPKLPANRLLAIRDYLAATMGLSAQLRVQNARFQPVRVRLAVRFHAGLEFHYYQQQLQADLQRLLSPWSFDDAAALSFGGRLSPSVLLHQIEQLPYVDYLSDFALMSAEIEAGTGAALAASADSVLVSADSHLVLEASP